MKVLLNPLGKVNVSDITFVGTFYHHASIGRWPGRARTGNSPNHFPRVLKLSKNYVDHVEDVESPWWVGNVVQIIPGSFQIMLR